MERYFLKLKRQNAVRIILLVTIAIPFFASLFHHALAFTCDVSPDPWFKFKIEFDKSTLPAGVEFISKNEYVTQSEYGKFSLKNNGITPLYLIEAKDPSKPVYSYPNSELPPLVIPRYKLVDGKAYYYTTYPFEYRQNAGGIDNSAAYELNINQEELKKMGVEITNVHEDDRPDSVSSPVPQNFSVTAYRGSNKIEIKGVITYVLNENYDPKTSVKKKESCEKALKVWEKEQGIFTAFPLLNTFSLFLPYIAIVLLIIPILVSIKRWNSTIEKERAWAVLKRTRSFVMLSPIIWSFILLYSHFRVYTALDNVFKAFNHPTPFLLKFAPYSTFIVILVLIILAFYIYFSKSISNEFEERLERYKSGEKIKIRELAGRKLNQLTILTFVIPFIALILFVLIPGIQIISMVSNLPLK